MYEELNLSLAQDESVSMLKKQVHELAVKDLRPISLQLDKMHPQEVVEKGSPYYEAHRKIKQMGLHRMYTRKEYGGLESTPEEIHVVLEEVAWASMGFGGGLGVDMCCMAIIMLANDIMGGSVDEMVNDILIPWVEDEEGKYHGCIPWLEPEHGSDILLACHLPDEQIAGFGLRAPVKMDRDGDYWVFNGMKAPWTTSGPTATHGAVIVNAPPHESISDATLAFVPFDLEGVRKGPALDKLGMRDEPQGEIIFDNVRVPKEYVIMIPGLWKSLGGSILAQLNSGMGALYTGLARAAFEEALKYARERVQGGKPLIEHDSIKMRLADMFMRVEACRSYSRAAFSYSFQKIFKDIELEFPKGVCYACKVFCTQQALEVASEAIQIHGGYGITKDSVVEKLFRDARMGLIMDGCNRMLTLTAGWSVDESYSPE